MKFTLLIVLLALCALSWAKLRVDNNNLPYTVEVDKNTGELTHVRLNLDEIRGAPNSIPPKLPLKVNKVKPLPIYKEKIRGSRVHGNNAMVFDPDVPYTVHVDENTGELFHVPVDLNEVMGEPAQPVDNDVPFTVRVNEATGELYHVPIDLKEIATGTVGGEGDGDRPVNHNNKRRVKVDPLTNTPIIDLDPAIPYTVRVNEATGELEHIPIDLKSIGKKEEIVPADNEVPYYVHVNKDTGELYHVPLDLKEIVKNSNPTKVIRTFSANNGEEIHAIPIEKDNLVNPVIRTLKQRQFRRNLKYKRL